MSNPLPAAGYMTGRAAVTRFNNLAELAGALLPATVAAMTEAAQDGKDEVRMSFSEARIFEGEALIKCLISRDYRVTNTSGIKPTDPLELRIQW